jgi:hypothetical protein
MDDLFTRLADDLARYWNNARRLTALWGPTATLPGWAAPAVALTSLLALVLISGVALASLGVLLTALLTAHLLLEYVFGISISVRGRA